MMESTECNSTQGNGMIVTIRYRITPANQEPNFDLGWYEY